jgi:hypothetical protein
LINSKNTLTNYEKSENKPGSENNFLDSTNSDLKKNEIKSQIQSVNCLFAKLHLKIEKLFSKAKKLENFVNLKIIFRNTKTKNLKLF